MPVKSPVSFRAEKLFLPTKTTMKVLAESLGALTDQFVAALTQLDTDNIGFHTYATTFTPQPRVTLGP